MNQLKIYLPPPSNWQDFQLLIKYVAESRYLPDSVIEYGRLGQSQHGVDTYAEDRSGGHIGFQCKERKAGLKIGEIEAEAKEAMKFKPQLTLFIIATTDRIDKNLQDEANRLNATKNFPFRIRIDFWDDFVNEINRYSMVINSCYDAYVSTFHQSDEGRHAAMLRISFDRPAYKDDFKHERNYGNFCEALADTKRLFRTGFALDRDTQLTIIQTVPVDLLPQGRYRSDIIKIEGQIEKLYQTCITELQQLQNSHIYASDRSTHYNDERRKIIGNLNKLLKRLNCDPIIIGY